MITLLVCLALMNHAQSRSRVPCDMNYSYRLSQASDTLGTVTPSQFSDSNEEDVDGCDIPAADGVLSSR